MAAKKKANDSSQPPHRGKTESSSSSSSSTNTNKTKTKNEVATAMQDQLNRSRNQLHQNKVSTLVLHRQWKSHLLNLSYLLIVISFMQLKGPSSTCLQDIKAYNNNKNQQQEENQIGGGSLVLISGLEAMQIVCMDSIVPAIAIIMAAALSFFLIQAASVTIYTNSQFSNPRYIFACLCIPILLISSHVVQSKGDKEGCIDDLLLQAGILPSEQEIRQRPSRGFPVVLVFHVIVTMCFGFMESQMKLHERGIIQVDNLLQELQDSTLSDKDNNNNKSKTTTSKDDVVADADKPTESKKVK
jgi:hypothetical protein